MTDPVHSLKFTVFVVVVAFTKKEKDTAASRARTQSFSAYFSVRKRFIFILCFVYMLSYGESKSSNIIRVVKYVAHDEDYKL